MPIQFQKRAFYGGMHGTVTVAVELISRDEFMKTGLKMPEKVMSIGEIMKANKDSRGLHVCDHLTNSDDIISWETLVQTFKGFDLDNSIAHVSSTFKPDTGQSRYPSEMADAMRNAGFPEEKIQELIQWEKEIKK